MRISAVRIAGVCAVAAALTFSAAACSGSQGKSAACGKLSKTIIEVTQKGQTQASDPNLLAATYSAGANTIRQEGKDSGDDKVEKAANGAASALVALGQELKNISSGSTSKETALSDWTNANIKLNSACKN